MKDNFDLHEWNKKRYLGELDIDKNTNSNIDKIKFTYIENSGKLYKVETFAKDKRDRLDVDEANDLLKILNIQDELPYRINNDDDEKLLDNIVKQLQNQDIEASWNDAMDIG